MFSCYCYYIKVAYFLWKHELSELVLLMRLHYIIYANWAWRKTSLDTVNLVFVVVLFDFEKTTATLNRTRNMNSLAVLFTCTYSCVLIHLAIGKKNSHIFVNVYFHDGPSKFGSFKTKKALFELVWLQLDFG